MNNTPIYGAFASILIHFDGDLHELSAIVASALNLSSIDIETDEYEPHNEIASAETMGWEIWLEKCTGNNKLFALRAETEHSYDEIFAGRMHDLSPWLSRFIGMMCDLSTEPTKPDDFPSPM